MNRERVEAAKQEANRFLQRVAELDALEWKTVRHVGYGDQPAWESCYANGEGAANAAVKRSSLDLTRALAQMRKA